MVLSEVTPEDVFAKKQDMEQAMQGGSATEVVESVFGFASALGKLMAENDAKKKEAARLKRNARARARYKAQKAAGTLPSDKKRREAEERELELLEEAIWREENAHRCGCMDPGAMPPCGHCEGCEECAEDEGY